jgi:hypothetical protein
VVIIGSQGVDKGGPPVALKLGVNNAKTAAIAPPKRMFLILVILNLQKKKKG